MRKLSMEELGRKSAPEFRQASKTPILLVLDNIRSMNNVGSIFRTADAFLLEGIFLCGYTPRPPHRDIEKTALGATGTVAWQYFSSTLEALAAVEQRAFLPWAVEQVENSTPLQSFSLRERINEAQGIALVLGNEVSGVDQQVIDACRGAIEIPQSGSKHSLNIAVAAGIVIWELFSQYQK